jgi:hypothetical protein
MLLTFVNPVKTPDLKHGITAPIFFSFSASIPFYINLHTLKDRNFILHGIYFNGKANNSPPPVNYKRLNQ